MARDWSVGEVDAIVEDYFSMFRAEIQGEPFGKAQHRRVLAGLLQNRSSGSIERKHQNISAVLIDLGLPYVAGYKPLGNYQGLLLRRVAEHLDRNPQIEALVKSDVERRLQVPHVEDILAAFEEAPPRAQPRLPKVREQKREYSAPGERVDYLAREAANQALGDAGEEFVLRFETARLLRAGRENLADRIEHVARHAGDRAGFDIRSFETNGRDRFIEVKTTSYGKETPFYLSRNELRFSQQRSAEYQLYRVYGFRYDPRLFALPGAIDQNCILDPVQFVARR